MIGGFPPCYFGNRPGATLGKISLLYKIYNHKDKMEDKDDVPVDPSEPTSTETAPLDQDRTKNDLVSRETPTPGPTPPTKLDWFALIMTSFFHVTRLTVRAVLVPSLLVLGHFLLISGELSCDTTTVVEAPYESPYLAPSSTPDLVPALKATSAILFHTLLWTVFVLFEEVDQGRLSTRDTEECGYLFVCTGSELVLNSILFGAWISASRLPSQIPKRPIC